MFYLRIGDVVVEDGASSTAYTVTGHPSFPEPEPDGYGGHRAAVRRFDVYCTGTTASAAHNSAALLRREAVKGAYLYFRHGTVGDVLSCRIRDARIVEAEYSPGVRDGFGVLLNVTLTTDPYWLGEWTATTSASADVTLPADHFDITGVTGEVDALLTLRVVPTTSATLLAVGVKPEPSASYTYLDDYAGAALTNALDGSATAKVTASAAYAALGTAPSLNTNHCRGRHLMLARADASATGYSDVYFKGRVTTTGNAIGTSVSVDEQPVAATASSLVVYALGDVVIPAGQVPEGSFESGSSATTIGASGSDSSAIILTTLGEAAQTFPMTAGDRLTGITVKTGTSHTASAIWLTVYTASAGGLNAAVYTAPSIAAAAASTEYTVPCSYAVPTTGTYGFSVATVASTGSLLYSSSSTYASGNRVQGSTNSSGDLYFKVTTDTPLGFVTTNPVLDAEATASAGVSLDYVCRVPVDYAALVYRQTTSSSVAVYYDGDTDTPYAADSDGIGPAQYDKCEVRRPLRVKPGVTNRVVVAIGQGDEAIAGVDTLTYKYRPRYLTATG